MSGVSEIIIWLSPLLGGLTLYLLHDAFSTLKDDIKDLRDRQVRTREDISTLSADTRVVGDKVGSVEKSVDNVVIAIRDIDSRSGNTKEMGVFLKGMEARLSTHEANYGKVILILQKLAGRNPPQK